MKWWVYAQFLPILIERARDFVGARVCFVSGSLRNQDGIKKKRNTREFDIHNFFFLLI